MRGYVTAFSRSYLRKRATHLMEDSGDTCVIKRPGEAKVIVDPITNEAERVLGQVVVYEGACRLVKPGGGGKSEYQEKDVAVEQTLLALPFDAGVPQMNDVVTMTGSDDPEVVGSQWTVQDTERAGGLRGSRVVTVKTFDHEKPEEQP